MSFVFWNFVLVKTLHLFFQKRFATGISSPSLLIPLFAKNSRLGYFFNANNLHLFFQKRFATGTSVAFAHDQLRIKFANANLV